MPRLSADQWAAVRLEWEGEPTASFLGLAGKHGLQASSISRRAASEGWTKRGVIGDIHKSASSLLYRLASSGRLTEEEVEMLALEVGDAAYQAVKQMAAGFQDQRGEV